jgi:hypothetical protein
MLRQGKVNQTKYKLDTRTRWKTRTRTSSVTRPKSSVVSINLTNTRIEQRPSIVSVVTSEAADQDQA